MPGRKKIQDGSAPHAETYESETVEGVDMRYFEQEMQQLPMQGLQRWFIAAGSRQKAEQIARLMVQRFMERLAVILDGTNLPD